MTNRSENFETIDQGSEIQDSGADFSTYWQILLERKKLIFSITGIAFVFSTVVFFAMPNVYEAQVQLLVEKPGKTQELYQQTSGSSFSGEEDYYGTQVSMLSGRKIADKIEEELELSPSSFKVKAKRIPASRVISLTVRYSDPEVSAKIANKLTAAYIDEKNQQDLYLPRQLLEMLPSDTDIDAEFSEVPSTASNTTPLKTKKELPVSFLNKITTDPLIMKLDAQRLDVESQIREYSQRYKWKHPVMLSLNEKLSFIKSQTKDRKKKILSDLRTSLTGEFNVSNIKVLSPAEPPQNPVSPKRLLGILLSTLGGLVVSVYLSVILESSNQKLRHEEDLASIPGVVYLGSIPLVKELMMEKKSEKSNKKHTVPLASPQNITQIFRKDPILLDAMAKVRTHILFASSYDKAKSMMITSGTPNEGKSTAISLLALSLEGMGRKVIIIDADLRRPSTHTYFKISNEKGLREYLEGSATVEEILRDIPGTTTKIVTGGLPMPNPTELLTNDRFGELLNHLSGHCDRILIDVPPVLFIPDSFILAKNVHSTVFICRAGVTEKKALRAMMEQFEGLRPLHSVVGVVLNGIEFDKYQDRYKYFKSYKNYYQSPEVSKKGK